MVLQSQCCLDFQQFSLDILKTLFVVLLILYADESQACLLYTSDAADDWLVV